MNILMIILSALAGFAALGVALYKWVKMIGIRNVNRSSAFKDLNVGDKIIFSHEKGEMSGRIVNPLCSGYVARGIYNHCVMNYYVTQNEFIKKVKN